MNKFKIPERNQALILSNVNLESSAPIGSAVRSINDLVDALDTSSIEEGYKLDSAKGRYPFHPKTYIKVALFAIHNCRFSLRKMEYDTGSSLPYLWLTGNEKIDHTTIGKFLSKNRKFIEPLFNQVVTVAIEHDLVDFDVLAIDSVKLRANASYKQNKTLTGISKEEEKIQKRIKEVFDGIDQALDSKREEQALQDRLGKLNAAKVILKNRIDKKSLDKNENQKKKIKEKESINITDCDSNKMQQRNGEINPSYSVTTSTDTKADIITHYQTNKDDNDNKALLSSISGSEEKCKQKHDIVDADSAFSSFENLESLQKENQKALIPDKRLEVEKKGEQKLGQYARSYFSYNKEVDEYTCPEGQKLFSQKTSTSNGRTQKIYSNTSACHDCSALRLCTKASNRTITRDTNEEIKEQMRVTLSEDENKKTYKLRAHTAESPFGNIKHNLKYRILMRRKIDRVHMEIGLLCMLHNILKISRYSGSSMP